MCRERGAGGGRSTSSRNRDGGAITVIIAEGEGVRGNSERREIKSFE